MVTSEALNFFLYIERLTSRLISGFPDYTVCDREHAPECIRSVFLGYFALDESKFQVLNSITVWDLNIFC